MSWTRSWKLVAQDPTPPQISGKKTCQVALIDFIVGKSSALEEVCLRPFFGLLAFHQGLEEISGPTVGARSEDFS